MRLSLWPQILVELFSINESSYPPEKLDGRISKHGMMMTYQCPTVVPGLVDTLVVPQPLLETGDSFSCKKWLLLSSATLQQQNLLQMTQISQEV